MNGDKSQLRGFCNNHDENTDDLGQSITWRAEFQLDSYELKLRRITDECGDLKETEIFEDVVKIFNLGKRMEVSLKTAAKSVTAR